MTQAFNQQDQILKALTDALDISPITVATVGQEMVAEIEQNTESKEEITKNEKLAQDFDAAREITRNAIKRTADQLERLISIAASTENPRAFEVLGTFMKSIVDANQSLLDMHKQKQEIENPKPSKKLAQDAAPAPQITQQNVFVGSSDELDDLLEKGRQKRNVIDATDQDL
jgi:predicted NBD/HSP70 family sugar kinase